MSTAALAGQLPPCTACGELTGEPSELCAGCQAGYARESQVMPDDDASVLRDCEANIYGSCRTCGRDMRGDAEPDGIYCCPEHDAAVNGR